MFIFVLGYSIDLMGTHLPKGNLQHFVTTTKFYIYLLISSSHDIFYESLADFTLTMTTKSMAFRNIHIGN